MATQKCPKCKSKEIRQGYRPTPLLLKVIFLYNLLCDNCNWEFRGFAIPGTVPRKTKRKKNPKDLSTAPNSGPARPPTTDSVQTTGGLEIAKKSEMGTEPQFAVAGAEGYLNSFHEKQKARFKRKVRVRLH